MPRRKDLQELHSVMDSFRDRCLSADGSLLWNDAEVWTLDNLMAVKVRFIDEPSLGERSFWKKLPEQFKGQTIECYKILADAFIVYSLPSVFIKPATKWGYVERVAEMAGIAPPDPKPVKDALSQGFTRTAFHYHAKYMQLWLIISFAIKLKQTSPEILNRPWDTALVLDQCLQEFPSGSRAYDMRSAILYMMYPDVFEPIISNQHKRKVVETFLARDRQESSGIDTPEARILLDRDVAKAKQVMIEKYKPEVASFYSPRILNLWNIARDAEREVEDTEPPVLDPMLEGLVGPLRDNGQLILYGPPGTGKTYYAMKLAKAVVATDNIADLPQSPKARAPESLAGAEARGSSAAAATLSPGLEVGGVSGIHGHIDSRTDSDIAADPDDHYVRLCTFHPAYGYEDFIEGYKPYLTSDGQPYYRVEDGIFKRICSDARQQPDKTFVLIIDEINRGNIPRIFGELITLIESDKRWKPGNANQFSAVLPTSHESFSVPDNLYIIGTMNTADKSIALLDTALRRRFAFREIPPEPDLLANHTIEGIPLDKLMAFLNEKITVHLNKNLQIGHAYFMDGTEAVRTAQKLASVLRDKVFPLLQDYCYDDYGTLWRILGDDIIDQARNTFRRETITPGKDEEMLRSVRRLLEGDDG